MRILLPPSETKRDGGAEGSTLDLALLGFPGLNPARLGMLASLRTLSRNRTVAAKALHLGPKQLFEVDRNRHVRVSPVMPACDRYTGVLFEALDAPSLPEDARSFAGESVIIHSALFGLVRGLDPIPAYRLSHDSRIPDRPLGATWRGHIARELESLRGEFILDMRSEAYCALGAAPESSWFLRVVSEDSTGVQRALNHFNKKGKGSFVRELVLSGIEHDSAESLLEWATEVGIRLSRGAGRELILAV